MTGALSRLRSELTAQLNRAGIPALAAYEPERQVRRTEPVAAVSLAKVVCAPGGFRDYLGRRTAADGTEEELYGRAVELTLELSKLLQAYVVGRAQKDAEDARLLAEFADLVDISGLRQAEKDELFSVFQNYQHCAETILQQIKDKTESVEQEARPGKYRMREKYSDELRTFTDSFTLRLKSFFDDRYDARAAVCLWDYNFKL